MIGLIVNKNARRLQGDPGLLDRIEAAGASEIDLRLTESPEQVGPAVDAFRSAGAEVVAACGGDGTASLLLAEMARAYPPRQLPTIAILPAGTMNTIAGNLRVPRDPERALQIALAERRRIADDGTEAPAGSRRAPGERSATIEQTTMTVNRRPCFIFGGAMSARFLELYYRRRAGVGTAVELAIDIPLAAIFGTDLAHRLFDPVAAEVVADGERLAQTAWTLLVASTLTNIGLGVRITYRGGTDPCRFQLIASALSARALSLQFHRTFLGRALHGAGHHDRLVSSATITFERDESYILDGELLSGRSLQLAVGPRIKVCVGR